MPPSVVPRIHALSAVLGPCLAFFLAIIHAQVFVLYHSFCSSRRHPPSQPPLIVPVLSSLFFISLHCVCYILSSDIIFVASPWTMEYDFLPLLYSHWSICVELMPLTWRWYVLHVFSVARWATFLYLPFPCGRRSSRDVFFMPRVCLPLFLFLSCLLRLDSHDKSLVYCCLCMKLPFLVPPGAFLASLPRTFLPVSSFFA